MKLTKNIVPLPYSDCLLTDTNLKTVSEVIYPDGGSLRQAIKVRCTLSIPQRVCSCILQVIDKNNKRLKGSNPLVTHRRYVFERVRSFWREKKGVWCALDFEAWERDHTVLTEFGWCFVAWENGVEVEEQGHLIVDEARFYTNSQYVPDHRYVSLVTLPSFKGLIQTQNYTFGKSETVKKVVFRERIHDLFARLASYGPVFLVFHDNNQDIK